jgi:hypothetical protein
MRIKLFIRCHPYELLQGSAACGVVRGEETRNELKQFGSVQGVRFVPAHFGCGSHKDEASQVFLSIVADVVTDERLVPSLTALPLFHLSSVTGQ